MTSPAPRFDGGDNDRSAVATSNEPEQRSGSESTVGTGSALGVGCLAGLVVFVIVAIAARWLMGAW